MSYLPPPDERVIAAARCTWGLHHQPDKDWHFNAEADSEIPGVVLLRLREQGWKALDLTLSPLAAYDLGKVLARRGILAAYAGGGSRADNRAFMRRAWSVVSGETLLAVYDPKDGATLDGILTLLTERLPDGRSELFMGKRDVAIWRNGRLLAVVRRNPEGPAVVTRFDDF